MIPRHVETIYCDDIRQELGGKISCMGIYFGRMFVQDFPAVLPKLCLLIKILTPADEPFRSLTLKIFKDDECLRELAVNDQQLANASRNENGFGDEDQQRVVHMTQFIVTFSPMLFDGPCTLRIRVVTEDGELRGVGLKVQQIQNQ